MGANAKKRRDAADTAQLSREEKIAAAGGGPRRGAGPIVLATGLAIALIAAVVAGVVWSSNKDKGSGDALPKGVASMTSPITAYPGKATAQAATLDVYEDFQCPGCQSFEKTLGPTLKSLAEGGKVKVRYHMMNFLDGNLGNDSSTRAALGAFCAADQGKFEAFHDAVYANAPAKEGDGYSPELLTSVAKQVGLDVATWQKCVDDKTHQGYLDKLQEQTAKDGVTSTPTLKLNGTALKLPGMTPESFTKAIEDAAKK